MPISELKATGDRICETLDSGSTTFLSAPVSDEFFSSLQAFCFDSISTLFFRRSRHPARAAMTCSPYRIGIRTVVHRPSRMTDAKSTFNASKSCVAPTRTECPLTCSTSSAGILRNLATALNARATASGLRRPPILPFPCRLYVTVPRPMIRRNTAPSLMPAFWSQTCR